MIGRRGEVAELHEGNVTRCIDDVVVLLSCLAEGGPEGCAVHGTTGVPLVTLAKKHLAKREEEEKWIQGRMERSKGSKERAGRMERERDKRGDGEKQYFS